MEEKNKKLNNIINSLTTKNGELEKEIRQNKNVISQQKLEISNQKMKMILLLQIKVKIIKN